MISLNPELAVQGSAMGAGLIDKSGAYKGRITGAKYETGQNGSCYVELSFERDDGAKANYNKLYTVKNNGTEGFGLKQIHAMMACLKLRQISGYEQFIGLEIGLALQREEYNKQDGTIGYSMKLVAPFEYATKKTSEEILKNLPAAYIDQLVASLVDKKAPANRFSYDQSQHNNSHQNIGMQQNTGMQQTPPMDDEIPF